MDWTKAMYFKNLQRIYEMILTTEIGLHTFVARILALRVNDMSLGKKLILSFGFYYFE